jgi:hypothetical protein
MTYHDRVPGLDREGCVRVHWCYASKDIVTEEAGAWHDDPHPKCPGSVGTVVGHGASVRGNHRASSVRPPVGRLRKGDRSGQQTQKRRRCAPGRGSFAPRSIPLPVPGAKMWSPWNNIPARRRAIAAQPVDRRWHGKGQRHGCGGCASDAGRRPCLLRILSYRNSTQTLPGQPCGWWPVPETEERMTRRGDRHLPVRVTFAASRLAAQCLHDAYDQVLPRSSQRRPEDGTPTTVPAAQTARRPAAQERA